MCGQEVYVFTECEHRLAADHIDYCDPVRNGPEPQCDTLQEQVIPMGEKCHDCLEQAQQQAQRQQQADEEAEFERMLAESNRTFEEERTRDIRPSEQEEVDLERALRESAEIVPPQHSEWKDDEDEIARALAASQETVQPTHHDWMDDVTELAAAMEASKLDHEEASNKPKNFLRQKLRYTCNHELDAGLTDIEFDPMSPGLPYIQIDERGLCPSCGGSSSHAAIGRTGAVPNLLLGDAESAAAPASFTPQSVDQAFSGFDDGNLVDLDPQGRGKGKRPVTPPPAWTPADEYKGARPDDPYAVASLMPAGPGLTQDSTHPSPSALRQQRLNAFQPHQATPTISSQPDQGEISDADSETLEMPPYATVDNLALEHLIGEQREQAERAERNKVERLRLEGALARQDAGDFSDPVPKQD